MFGTRPTHFVHDRHENGGHAITYNGCNYMKQKQRSTNFESGAQDDNTYLMMRHYSVSSRTP